jgi:hypothetical protein
VRIHKKSERRDLIREKKAEKAAKISNAIQRELLSRLNDPEVDVYDGIYNFPQKEFKKVVQSQTGGLFFFFCVVLLFLTYCRRRRT